MKNHATFRRIAIRSVVTSVLTVAAASLTFAGTAVAQSDSSSSDAGAFQTPACAAASDAAITATISADGSATYTVQNSEPLCDAVPIGLAIYTKDADGFVTPQPLADSSTDTITTGSKTLTITKPEFGEGPACYFQIDAFTGDVLPEITDTDQYRERLLAYQWGGFDTCILGESTTASTSTSTTTSTTTSTEPTTDDTVLPDQVLGEQITREPAQTAPLARTGTNDISPLMSMAGALFFAGGLTTAAANRRRRPRS